MSILAGCTLTRRPTAKYVRALPFVELAFDDPIPSPATLARWARELPSSLERAVVAPRSALVSSRGALRRDDAMTRAIARFAECAATVGARVLVVPTPTDLSPSLRDREVLRQWIAELPRDASRWIAWQPSGVWTDEDIVEEAARNDVVPIVDPIEDVLPASPCAYARIASLGARPRLTPSLLKRIVEALADHEHAFVALRTDHAFAEARALDALARSSTSSA